MEREDKEREISENIKKAIKILTDISIGPGKWLAVEAEANPHLDSLGKEVVEPK